MKSPREQREIDIRSGIAHFEGNKLEAYKCSAGKPTIGIGATYYEDGTPVRMGDKINQERAQELFEFHMADAMRKVKEDPGYQKLTPNAQGAVQSFAFNVGPNFMERGDDFATITRAIKAGDPHAVADALPLYDNGGTPGLVRRRKWEADLARRPAMDPVDSTLRNDRTRALGTEAVLGGKTVRWAGENFGWQSPESYDKVYNR